MNVEMIITGPNDSSIDIIVPSSTSVNIVGVIYKPETNTHN